MDLKIAQFLLSLTPISKGSIDEKTLRFGSACMSTLSTPAVKQTVQSAKPIYQWALYYRALTRFFSLIQARSNTLSSSILTA